MNPEKVWIINCSGGIDPRYGWFETKEDCEKKCNELNDYYQKAGANMWFKPYDIKKAVLKGV